MNLAVCDANLFPAFFESQYVYSQYEVREDVEMYCK